MDNPFLVILVGCFLLSVGYSMGTQAGHSEVVLSCQRVSSFYVGDKVFDCKERK